MRGRRRRRVNDVKDDDGDDEGRGACVMRRRACAALDLVYPLGTASRDVLGMKTQGTRPGVSIEVSHLRGRRLCRRRPRGPVV